VGGIANGVSRPASHADLSNLSPTQLTSGIITIVALIILGAVLWGVGASHGNPAMLMAGKAIALAGAAGLGVIIVAITVLCVFLRDFKPLG